MEHEKDNRKIVLIVLDSLGIGAAADAANFNDIGAHTFGHILEETPDLVIPNMREMGLFEIESMKSYSYLGKSGKAKIDIRHTAFGRCEEVSRGKDTTTGHWELMGIKTEIPFNTYPQGFPKEFIEKFQKKIGRKVLGNKVASGTEIIEVLGPLHECSGHPIVYTSADSVFQIAANTEVIPPEELYSICETARELLVGPWACGRVIARPYIIQNGKRVRTSDRRDFSVDPPELTVLDYLKKAGEKVVGVGKISDIFKGRGISASYHITDNMDGIDKTVSAVKEEGRSFVFTNLVDFDSKYGHRRDAAGYGKAIESFDRRLPEIVKALGNHDILMLTADHGNDPTFRGTDHTREYIPLLVYSKLISEQKDLGIRKTFSDIGKTVEEFFCLNTRLPGKSFLKELIR